MPPVWLTAFRGELEWITRRSSGSSGRRLAGLDREAAERALQAVLQTLAERLLRGEARRLLQELPAELKPWIYTEKEAEAFGIDEFLDRVAKREDTDIETALRQAQRRPAACRNVRAMTW
jgi:uncharacterized protein (DUF2267 family)